MRASPFVAPLLALLVLWLPRPTEAALTRQQLDSVGVERRLGEHLPGELRFRDRQGREATLGTLLGGRPALLLFADYGCKMVCGAALGFLAGLLSDLSEEADGGYGVLVVGLDPQDGPAEARQAFERHFGTAGKGPRPLFLTGEAAAIQRLAAAAGYHYAYDAERGEFAHPVVLIALDGEGRIVRYLPALGASARDLRLALGEAGAPSGGLLQGLSTLCYRFDPASGRYSPMITEILTAACGATVLLLAGGLLLLGRGRVQRRRARESSAGGGRA